MDTNTPQIDPINTPSKGRWTTFVEAMGNPFTFLTTWTKKSPLLTILAVVFLVQPVISAGIGIIQEWREVKEEMDPTKRPVSQGEFVLLNQKVDMLADMIVATAHHEHHDTNQPGNKHNVGALTSVDTTTVTTNAIAETNKKLDTLKQKLDSDYVQAKK